MNNLRQSLDEAPMSRFQWGAIGICMFLNMIDGFDVLVMAFTAAPVSAEWKLTGSQLGLLLSAGLFGMAAGSLFIAPWADRIGRRPITLGCLVLCGVTMVWAASAQSYQQLATARVFTGLGIGGILACSNVIASEYSSIRWRSLAVSLQSTGYALGATIGGSIAVWLLGHYGWRSVFMFGGVVTLAAVPLVLWRLPESLDFLLVRRPSDALQRVNRLARRLGMPALAEMPQVLRADSSGKGGVRNLLAPYLVRPTILVWVSFFFVMFGFYFVMSWTPKLLVAAGMTAQQGITSGVLLSVGGIFGSAAIGALAARFRVNRVLAVFMVVTAALLSVFVAQAGDQRMAFLLAFLVGVFVNACVAGLYAIAPLVYDASVRATGVGWGIGIGRIGAIVSPLVAGALIDDSWRPTQLYVGFGLAFVVAAIVVLLHRIQSPATLSGARMAAATAAH
jgi:benzoate transport